MVISILKFIYKVDFRIDITIILEHFNYCKIKINENGIVSIKNYPNIVRIKIVFSIMCKFYFTKDQD